MMHRYRSEKHNVTEGKNQNRHYVSGREGKKQREK
jgi:hypothetical protein